MAGELWTIGHWTCPEGVFLSRLDGPGIELVVDVRKLPGSRRSPQFNADQLQGWLADAGISYRQLPALAGRRGRSADGGQENAGWQNASFRNYADYTRTPEYEAGIGELTELAGAQRVAVLCGEPMPWRCHRLLIANTLTARGWTVWHLMADDAPRRHELGAWGATPVIDSTGRLTYPEN